MELKEKIKAILRTNPEALLACKTYNLQHARRIADELRLHILEDVRNDVYVLRRTEFTTKQYPRPYYIIWS